MLRLCIVTLLGVLYHVTACLHAQVIYVSSLDDNLYRLDIETCTYTFVAHVNREVFDITFHPNGSLYGISGNGNLYRIDTTAMSGGQTTLLYKFPYESSNNPFITTAYNSLTTSADGIIYATGDHGVLWSYTISSMTAIRLGNTGYSATGDLAFHNGELYVAVTDDRIVRINIQNPGNSHVVINANIPGNILGIVSFAETCSDINTYAITNGDSDIYLIDFVSKTLKFICGLDIEIGGGASTFEFIGSAPIVVDNHITENPTCGNSNGKISIQAHGGIGQLLYSIDGIHYDGDNVFSGLGPGTYTVYIADENGCDVYKEIELSDPYLSQSIQTEATNATCGNDNGRLILNVTGGAGGVRFSLDGVDYQSSPVFEHLTPSGYSIYIVDRNGCMDTAMAQIAMEPVPDIELITVQSSTCGLRNGSITVLMSSGKEPFLYSVDGISYQHNATFSEIPEGTHDIYVKDANDCLVDDIVFIEGTPGLSINSIHVAETGCEGNTGSMRIDYTGGTGSVTLSLNNGSLQQGDIVDGLGFGTYKVRVEDEAGCFADTTVYITKSKCPIYLPNIFSPNNDGINDLFGPSVHHGFDGIFRLMQIMDRWGNILYEARDFTAGAKNGYWDGSARGRPALSGIYMYMILVEYENGETNRFAGDVTLMK